MPRAPGPPCRAHPANGEGCTETRSKAGAPAARLFSRMLEALANKVRQETGRKVQDRKSKSKALFVDDLTV